MKERRLLSTIKKTTVVAAISLAACSPMREGMRPAAPAQPAPQPAAQQVSAQQSPIELGEVTLDVPAKASAPKQAARQSDPYELSQPLMDMAPTFTGNDMERVRALHARLRVGAPGGTKAVSMRGRAPRTAKEALRDGGDCTELAGITVAMLERMGVPGGALVVHFDSSPPEMHHMIPYAKLGGSDIVVDLQAGAVGQTKDGRYEVVLRMSYAQARAMYHTEVGDHHRNRGENQEAVAAYKRSLSIFEADPHVHHKLGIIYQQQGDMKSAGRHMARAGELDPQRYGKSRPRATYNQALEAGRRAYEAGRWAECAQHFRDALSSGESLDARERSLIQQNIDACEHNARVTSGTAP